ncbi:hypothetical protein ACIQVE_12365 [Pseudomonas sp. NPDC098747]|uniref:hypothetical protein n=1 Tax=Pseudomonas sp. NPDC098747 TaxID=3364487 RepID=UPI00383A7646
MLETNRTARRAVNIKVFALVLMIPLVPSILALPYPLGAVFGLVCVVASLYGAAVAVRHGSRKLATVAVSIAVLNTLSFFLLSSSSFLMGLYSLAYVFAPSLIPFG